MNLKEKGYRIYLSFLQTVLALAFILWVNDYFVLRVHLIAAILYCLVFSALIYFFDTSKNNAARYIALISLVPSLGLIFLVCRTNPFLWVKGIIDWCLRYDRTEDLYEFIPAYTVLAAAACLLSILFYIFMKKTVTRLLLAGIILSAFIALGIVQMNLNKAVVGIGIFYILCCLMEISGLIYGRKAGKADKKESILYLIPVCILLTVISISLPSKPEPIQWSGIKNIYYAIKNTIDKMITQWEFFTGKGDGTFSISLTGYSDDGSLDNEDLYENNKIALTVQGRKGLSPLYLTGSVSDTYTGYSWEKSDDGFLPEESEYLIDYAELIFGLSRLDPVVLEEDRFLELMTLTVFYKNIKTKTFFYPLKSYRFSFVNPVKGLETNKAGITFPKAMGDKAAYMVSYYELNLEGQKFREMLRSADFFTYENYKEINYDQIKAMESKFYVRDKDDFFLNREDFIKLLKKRAEIIRRVYTQLPDNLPKRVKDLAIELTKNEVNTYDKLKAIEAFLLKYTYSYKPGRVPEGWDFVDYFLFENKKGYCTSFATSMAVLARCAGIPTRYVEGFLVDYSDRAGEGYLVRNSNAHAWVEAYFEGIGWIPFEPTPGFHEIRYTVWPEKTGKANVNNYVNNIRIPQEPPSVQTPVIPKITEDEEKAGDILMWILTSCAVIFILLGAIAVYYLILKVKYKKEFDRADYNRKMYMLFIRILVMLKYEGFGLSRQETVLLLSDRIKDRYRYGNIVFGDVADIYMAYRYGEKTVSKEEFDTVQIFYKGLSEYRQENNSRLKQFMEEFAFLIRKNNINIYNY